MNTFQEVEELTIQLVQTPSLNNTTGERALADKIIDYLQSLAYYQQHPEYLGEVPLHNDPLGRKNVFALVKGEKAAGSATIILHGHMDTVGIDDFGALAPFAFDPQRLVDKLLQSDITAEVRADLESGDWLFGRGALDMKSGLAAHLVILKAMSQQVQNFSGNILFMANPVEENQHTGMIEALPVLKSLQEKHGFDYILAINNDYTSPLYSGDTKQYVYLGAVGKLLACFYIVGKETHVGQCFEGLDPNLIGAELMRLIDLNIQLCDEFDGETTLPPMALKFTDLKKAYNVQTPLATFLYFNFFVHHASTSEILDKLCNQAEQAVENVMAYVNQQYHDYCLKTSMNYTPLPFKPRVLTFQQLYQEVKAYQGDELDSAIRRIVDPSAGDGRDVRETCLAVVEEVKRNCRDTAPLIVVFFAPPYCPHNTLQEETTKEKLIYQLIKQTTDEMARQFDKKFEIRRFFPCLSDSSYLSIQDDAASISMLMENLPEWNSLYPVPVNLIKELSIPSINFGVYGKDAHRLTERVYKPYSFTVLPQMTKHAIENILTAFENLKEDKTNGNV